MSTICQVVIKSAFFLLNTSNSSVSLIVHWWTECCFSHCIVKSHAYPLVNCFQPRATLCNSASRQTSLFECDQSMLWLPIVEHSACFSHIQFQEKICQKHFSYWFEFLIERPYKWRHQFQVDLTVFKAKKLRTLLCLRCSEAEWRPTSGDLWSGMKVKILYYLLENSRLVLSSTLTFGYAIVYFFSTKNYKSIYRNGDRRPNCFNGSYWLFLLQKEIILLDFTLRIFCHNSVLWLLFNVSPEVTCKHAWSLCCVGSVNVKLEGEKCNKGFLVVNKINASCDC